MLRRQQEQFESKYL